MSESGRTPARVGVRELRQNLSVYLDRVRAGESLEVTEHGRPVARLVPDTSPPQTRLEQMIANGEATAATGRLEDLPPPLEMPPGTPSVSELLIKMREEERY